MFVWKSTLTRTMTAAAFGGLVLTGLAVPAANAATPTVTKSCHNSIAAVRHDRHALTHAKSEAAHARHALRRAEKTKDAKKIAAAKRRLARAQARVATDKSKLQKANANRRHNCSTPSA